MNSFATKPRTDLQWQATLAERALMMLGDARNAMNEGLGYEAESKAERHRKARERVYAAWALVVECTEWYDDGPSRCIATSKITDLYIDLQRTKPTNSPKLWDAAHAKLTEYRERLAEESTRG